MKKNFLQIFYLLVCLFGGHDYISIYKMKQKKIYGIEKLKDYIYQQKTLFLLNLKEEV